MTASREDWAPTCQMEVLKIRAAALATVREFFDQRDYIEVETPLLSADTVVDAHIDPMIVHGPSGGFLQTSPEAAMKRLLSAGMSSCYQITKAFRAGETGQLHNPEFTIVEWYGVGTTWNDQISLTEQLVQHVQNQLGERFPDSVTDVFAEPFRRVTYESSFERIGISGVLEMSVPVLQREVFSRLPEFNRETLPENRDDLLNMLLSDLVEPRLGMECGEFLTSYPLSQAALAQRNQTDPRTACRFELYRQGVELCNGYHELVDADELERRELHQNSQRADALPGAGRLNAAMAAGLPKCSGVALGFDRLMMCLLSAQSIEKVIPFPFNRA